MGQNTHEVVDARTGQVMGSYASNRRALAAADRLDDAYGAVRYIVRRTLHQIALDAMAICHEEIIALGGRPVVAMPALSPLSEGC